MSWFFVAFWVGFIGMGIFSALTLWGMGKEVVSEYNNTPIVNKPAPVLSDTMQLVLQLLREGEWVETNVPKTKTLENPFGVRITTDTKFDGYRYGTVIRVYVRNDEEEYAYVSLNDYEREQLSIELDAYVDRERDRKRRELAYALAKRISTGTAVLGGSNGDGQVAALPAPNVLDAATLRAGESMLQHHNSLRAKYGLKPL